MFFSVSQLFPASASELVCCTECAEQVGGNRGKRGEGDGEEENLQITPPTPPTDDATLNRPRIGSPSFLSGLSMSAQASRTAAAPSAPKRARLDNPSAGYGLALPSPSPASSQPKAAKGYSTPQSGLALPAWGGNQSERDHSIATAARVVYRIA